MMNKSRFTPQEKVDVVLLGLKTPSTVSEVCRKHNIAPITYSRGKRQFINGGMDAFKPGKNSTKDMLDKENRKLKLIIGELYVELEYLKRNYGDQEMRHHLPVGFWKKLFGDIDELG